MAFIDSDTEWIDAEMLLNLVPGLKDEDPQCAICKWKSIALDSIASVNIDNIDLAEEEVSNICIVRFVDENGKLHYLGSEKTIREQLEEFDNEIGASHDRRDTYTDDMFTGAPLLVQITSSLNHVNLPFYVKENNKKRFC
jgi:hypothetical protein